MADGDEDIPRDAKIIKALLKSMGVEDYEPRVVKQFLELWYRYVVDILIDSQIYSEHAGKTAIDSSDVKLAIQAKVNFSFSQPPPREDMLELARIRNKIPLPKRVPGPGIPLPNEQDTLINPNFHLAFTRKMAEQGVEEEIEEEEDEEMADPDPDPKPNSEPNPNSTKEHHDTEMPQNRTTPLRVSFPLVDKRSR